MVRLAPPVAGRIPMYVDKAVDVVEDASTAHTKPSIATNIISIAAMSSFSKPLTTNHTPKQSQFKTRF